MKDKEKIRAEIERLLNKEWKWGSSIEAKFRCEAYRELLDFIDSLPEEPASEDLEKAADNYASGYKQVGYDEDEILSVSDAFIDGAKWQKEQMIDKACEWLEENKDHPLIECEDPCLMGYLTEGFIDEFRKAMEAEK